MLKNKPNYSYWELLKIAKEILGTDKKFLLVYDIIESRRIENQEELFRMMNRFHNRVNGDCYDKIVEGERSGHVIKKMEFVPMEGDAGWVFLNSTSRLALIMLLSERLLPAKCRWLICAEDDMTEIKKILR